MTKEELEKQKWNDIFLEDCAVYDKKIAEEYTTLQERIERLEKENLVLHEMNVKRIDLQKENEELKDKLNNLASVAEVRLANWQKYSELYNKAKDLIKNIIRVTWNSGWNYDLGWKVEAEKFLKESE